MLDELLLEDTFTRADGMENVLDYIENYLGAPTTEQVHIAIVSTDTEGSVSTFSMKTNQDNQDQWDYTNRILTPIQGTDVSEGWASNLFAKLSDQMDTVFGEAVDEVEISTNHDPVRPSGDVDDDD